ncbi:MAG TPA: hypothetical protein VFZ76_01235 [Anaerolineales bacterium]
MQKESFYSIFTAEEKAERGGLGKWLWMLAFLTLEILLIRWIMQMQQEAARRARVVDQARREAAKEKPEAPIQKAAKPLAEPQEDKPTKPDEEIKPSKMDDFRRLEGIGPKVNALLHEAGMRTYSDLAKSGEDNLREILRGANLYMLNPESWPEQAGLAAKGDWEALEALKEQLRGGRKR